MTFIEDIIILKIKNGENRFKRQTKRYFLQDHQATQVCRTQPVHPRPLRQLCLLTLQGETQVQRHRHSQKPQREQQTPTEPQTRKASAAGRALIKIYRNSAKGAKVTTE